MPGDEIAVSVAQHVLFLLESRVCTVASYLFLLFRFLPLLLFACSISAHNQSTGEQGKTALLLNHRRCLEYAESCDVFQPRVPSTSPPLSASAWSSAPAIISASSGAFVRTLSTSHHLHAGSPTADLLHEDTNLQGHKPVSVLLLDAVVPDRMTEIAVATAVRG